MPGTSVALSGYFSSTSARRSAAPAVCTSLRSRRRLRPSSLTSSASTRSTVTLRTRVDEPAYLAEATGLHVVYGPNLIYDGGPFGNAILTRYPVVESHNLRLPGTFGLEPRGLLTAIVIVDGRRVAFSSTHLTEGSGGRQGRLLQALAVARALHSMAAPTILAGDLNSDSTDVPGGSFEGIS